MASRARSIDRPIALLAAMAFITQLGVSVMLPLLPLYAQSMGATPFVLSLLVGGFAIALAIGQLASGFLAERFPSRRLVVTGIGLYAGANVAIAGAATAFQLIAFRAAAGLGSGINQVAERLYVTQVAERARLAFSNGDPVGGRFRRIRSWAHLRGRAGRDRRPAGAVHRGRVTSLSAAIGGWFLPVPAARESVSPGPAALGGPRSRHPGSPCSPTRPMEADAAARSGSSSPSRASESSSARPSLLSSGSVPVMSGLECWSRRRRWRSPASCCWPTVPTESPPRPDLDALDIVSAVLNINAALTDSSDTETLVREIVESMAAARSATKRQEFRKLITQSVSMTHMHVLATLREAGPLPVSRLAKALDVSVASGTGIITRMAERELVQRSRDDRDRRVVMVSLSDEGIRVLDEIDSRAQRFFARVLRELAIDELIQLRNGLRALHRAGETLASSNDEGIGA
jgi:DNA-binding MarR family transcriptional regulator